jgi:hypothetical protein
MCYIENRPIGVHTVTDMAETYLFGFHLWYMDMAEAQALLLAILPADCCRGLRGNVNGDPEDKANILDACYLVRYLYASGSPPPCELEADINGDEIIDILDLTYLVDHLFKGGPAPVECPPGERTRF